MSITQTTAEQYVIGACLQDPDASGKIMFLTADDFMTAVHKEMFRVIRECNESGENLDMMIMDYKADQSLVQFDYIAECAKACTSSANVVAYADIVKDFSNRRNLSSKLVELQEKLNDKRENTIESISCFAAEIDKVVSDSSIGEVMSIEDLIKQTAVKMEESNTGVRFGLKTGIQELDERLGYKHLAFGNITVLGGLSKNGKTLLGNTISARVELQDNEVGHIFSIEMTPDAMFNAMISAQTGVPANFYVKQEYYATYYPNDYDNMHGRWGDAAQRLYESGRFTFDGKKDIDADYICTNMKKQAAIARQKGKVLRYVLIDHFHRMNYDVSKMPLTYAMREAARKITNTAGELGIAVLGLAQLNNKAENENPTSFHILDSSSFRHELQAFIGIRMFRDSGGTYFGLFVDSQRFGDQDTKHHPAYMKLIGGVLSTLPENEKHWVPSVDNK